MDNAKEFFIVCTMLIFLLFVFIFDSYDKQEQAIKHGCAEYNRTTGNFQWIKHLDSGRG